MKKLLLSAAAVLALSVPAAHAQDQGMTGDKDRPQSAQKADKPDRDTNPQATQSAPAAPNAMRQQRTAQASGGMQGGGMQGDKDRDKDHPNAGDKDHPAAAPDRDDRARNGDRDDRMGADRNVHKTVDRNVIMKFRANVNAPHRFHFHAYVRPAGWYAHRWVFGERLPASWYVRDYWITDWAAFGLIEPWPGYTWVQVGNDALLIDIDTGEVVRVEYGIFY